MKYRGIQSRRLGGGRMLGSRNASGMIFRDDSARLGKTIANGIRDYSVIMAQKAVLLLGGTSLDVWNASTVSSRGFSEAEEPTDSARRKWPAPRKVGRREGHGHSRSSSHTSLKPTAFCETGICIRSCILVVTSESQSLQRASCRCIAGAAPTHIAC